MLIRAANEADVGEVLPMVRAICALHESRDPQRFRVLPDVLDRYARWLPERAKDPRSVFLVAERPGAGGLAGFTVGTVEPEIPIFWVPECGWIHDLWVEPADRRRGVGKLLAEAAAARFTEIGVQQVRLHTGAFNDAARAMFSECGFRVSVVEMLRPTGPAK
jgi:GNAT superfamily N-acetyltransferase